MNRITGCRGWAACVALVLAIGAAPVARADIQVTQVGAPAFVPTDFHLFTAPIGTPDTGFAELLGSLQSILPPPRHANVPALGIGPGTAHAGPYDQELGQGIAAAGFRESTRFTTAEFSNGMAVILGFMLVPGPTAPTGSSPDFAAGPILSNAIFPLDFVADTFTDGVLNDTGSFQVPALSTVPGFEGLDGHSHVPLFSVDSFEFATNDVPGAYEFRLTLRDAAGNGYDVLAPFQVQAIPEPSTWMSLALGLVCIGAMRLRRLARGDHG